MYMIVNITTCDLALYQFYALISLRKKMIIHMSRDNASLPVFPPPPGKAQVQGAPFRP